MLQEVNFEWVRGDDQFETLVFNHSSDDSPLDLSDMRIDLHIKPRNSEENTIKLSTEADTIKVEGNRVTFVVAHSLTEDVLWKKALWDLQITSPQGIVKTLVRGQIALIPDVTRST